MEYNEQIKKLRKQIAALENKENKEAQDRLYPSLAKKYNGKCFRYRNSNSPDSKWWLYVKVNVVLKNSIRETDNGVRFEFECDTYEIPKGYRGETVINIERKRRAGQWLLQQRITTAQFESAKAKIINKTK